jgi:uncharacterized protein (TIGR03083 family)
MTRSTDSTDAMTLPPELRERVLAASVAARAAGRSTPAVPDIAPTEALARAAAAFHSVLVVLNDADWHVPVLRDLDVQALVGHLTGVEEDVHRCLTGDESVAEVDHVVATQEAAERQQRQAPAMTRSEWRAAVDRTLAQVTDMSDLDVEVALHGMHLRLDDLLVVRAFELWTHENDIRRVVGLPPSAPDAATLQLMTSLAVKMLPRGAELTGLELAPLDVHLVLTGAGGGTWDLGLVEGCAAERVSIVVDAVDFCRLVADRVKPAELDVHVTGASERSTDVLLAASALALD